MTSHLTDQVGGWPLKSSLEWKKWEVDWSVWAPEVPFVENHRTLNTQEYAHDGVVEKDISCTECLTTGAIERDANMFMAQNALSVELL